MNCRKSSKAPEKTKRQTRLLMLLKLLQFIFSFTLKRSETKYFMLRCVIAILRTCKRNVARVNLLKSFAEAPTFICPINPRKTAHRCQSEGRWMSQERRSDCHLSSRDRHCRRGLTKRSPGPCLSPRMHTPSVNATARIIDPRSELPANPSCDWKEAVLFYRPSPLPLSVHLHNYLCLMLSWQATATVISPAWDSVPLPVCHSLAAAFMQPSEFQLQRRVTGDSRSDIQHSHLIESTRE